MTPKQEHHGQVHRPGCQLTPPPTSTSVTHTDPLMAVSFLNFRAEPESFHMSYWASLEIEMSLLGKRLSEVHFMKECVGFALRPWKLLNK